MKKMIKKIIVYTLLVFCFTGCTQRAPDEVELEFNNSVNPEEAVWKFNYETLAADLTDVGWIDRVEILPDSYEQYIKDKKLIIRITAVEGTNVTGHDKENIYNFVKNSGYADQFDIEYIE